MSLTQLRKFVFQPGRASAGKSDPICLSPGATIETDRQAEAEAIGRQNTPIVSTSPAHAVGSAEWLEQHEQSLNDGTSAVFDVAGPGKTEAEPSTISETTGGRPDGQTSRNRSGAGRHRSKQNGSRSQGPTDRR